MQRRLCFLFLTMAVLLAALVGGAGRASAAIRITISDGTTERVFYSTSSQTALFHTDLGAFDVVLQSTLSNFPGDSSGGTLSQSVILSDNFDVSGTVLPTFTTTSAVIQDIGGLSDGFVTDTGQLMAVRNAPLMRFTLPEGNLLAVSSDVHAIATGSSGGTVQNHTEVNGAVVSSLEVGINSSTDAEVEGAVDSTPAGYTLSSQVVFTGGTPGVSGLTISAVSGVTAMTPEPGSMVVWTLGMVGLLFSGLPNAWRRWHQ